MYGTVAERVDRDRWYGLIRNPYEAGSAFGAFLGGFFVHREWTPRKSLEKQSSMRPVAEYEAKYVNSAGYWASFYEAAIDICQDALSADDEAKADRFDVWALIAVRYNLRALGLRTECFRLAAEDPTYVKMVLLDLERHGEVVAADDLDAPLQ